MKYAIERNKRQGMQFAALLTACLLFLSACSSKPVAPDSAMAAAHNAIANAEQSDARQYAGAELDEARHQLAQAEMAVRQEEMGQAEIYAQRSRVSAELASARTEQAKAKALNEELDRGAKALLEEMERAGERK